MGKYPIVRALDAVKIAVLATVLIFVILELCCGISDRYVIRRHRQMAFAQASRHEDTWLGAPVMQLPTDMFTYAELMYKTRVEMVVETGTAGGGLTIFLATVLRQVAPGGKVVTIDIDDAYWSRTVAEGKVPDDLNERIIFMKGSSVAPEIVERVRAIVGGKRVMVILDSAHLTDHVRKELELYGPIVSPGCYMIVNDTYFEEFGKYGPLQNPARAARDFVRGNDEFEIDASLPRFHASCAPAGFLRRVEKGVETRPKPRD